MTLTGYTILVKLYEESPLFSQHKRQSAFVEFRSEEYTNCSHSLITIVFNLRVDYIIILSQINTFTVWW